MIVLAMILILAAEEMARSESPRIDRLMSGRSLFFSLLVHADEREHVHELN
jgi:hypothetical protein